MGNGDEAVVRGGKTAPTDPQRFGVLSWERVKGSFFWWRFFFYWGTRDSGSGPGSSQARPASQQASYGLWELWRYAVGQDWGPAEPPFKVHCTSILGRGGRDGTKPRAAGCSLKMHLTLHYLIYSGLGTVNLVHFLGFGCYRPPNAKRRMAFSRPLFVRGHSLRCNCCDCPMFQRGTHPLKPTP